MQQRDTEREGRYLNAQMQYASSTYEALPFMFGQEMMVQRVTRSTLAEWFGGRDSDPYILDRVEG